MDNPGTVILILKVAVSLVTVLLVASLIALWRKRPDVHRRINIVVFILTIAALLSLEVLSRVLYPNIFNEHFTRTDSWGALYTHLGFAVPSALLLVVMLSTGLTRRIRVHYWLGWLFLVCWAGTFVTGVFFLPH